MRYIASLILACCLVSPAFAGQEFCQISNPGGCASHDEAQASSNIAPVQFTMPGLHPNAVYQRHDAPAQANRSEYTLLDLDLLPLETPSTPR